MGYTKLTLGGFSWISGLRVFTRILSYIRTIILARILTPAEFGVFGVATIILTFFEIITDTGINAFLIQHNERIEKYLNTAWIISIIRGFLIALVIFLLAPFISTFFKMPESLLTIQLISIVPLIRGFINPMVIKFQKELKFNKQFYYRSSLFFVETMMSIIFVLIYPSTVSLVLGLIVGAVFEVIVSYFIVKPVPVFSFDYGLGKQIVSRGKWVTMSGIFSYFFHNIDDIVVGRLLGASSLGIYQMAYKFSTLPINEISVVINQVTFPVYVKIREDKNRLLRAFVKTELVVLALTVPFGFLLYVFAEEIVLMILGSKWISVIPILRVLVIFGVVQAVIGSSHALFLGIERQHYITVITFIGFLILAILIAPFIYTYGLIGAGYAVNIATLSTVPIVAFYLWRVFGRKSI